MAKETIITFRMDDDQEENANEIIDKLSSEFRGFDVEFDVIEIPDVPHQGGGPKRTKKSGL